MLEKLNVENNNLGGLIPPSLMNCTNMVSLILRGNKLKGNISTLNFSRLVQLQKLDLSRNMFTGTLPESLYSCKAIVELRVAYNINLTGRISPKIAQLKSLSFLSLTNNSFTNITSTLQILAGLKNLNTLLFGYNFYGESLPSDRSFIGSNGFPKLQFISLISCNFTGYFPEWIEKRKSLRVLQMSHNRITGTIPNWLGALPSLFSLELSNNLMLGEIPRELCLLQALVSANISELNHFHFDLQIFSLFPGRHSWDQFIDYPSQINLQYNWLSSTVPSEIGELQNLHMLYLNSNNLCGEIPIQISNLKNLEELSLAENHLTGEIPAHLRGLSFLCIFNVSDNDLEGPIPTGGQFDTFQASSYEGNSGLCGELLQRPCYSEHKDQPEDNDYNDRQSLLDGLFVGFASGFSCVLAVVASFYWYQNLYLQRVEALR